MSKQINNTKAGLYYRLSQEDERSGESLSIENQKLIVEKYARDNGFEIVDEYVDDGYSGTNFNRPGVQRMFEDAKSGRINAIIVKDMSRFGRNYIEVGQYTDYIFPTYNIRFIAVSDNHDSAKDETGGINMLPVVNVFNEWHAANTSKKLREVFEANAKEGKYRAGFAPYGYVAGNDEKRLPVRDEPAASNVLRMFELRAQGMSPNRIASIFNEEKILIPSDYKQQKFGSPNNRRSHHLWSGNAVKQMLHNPTYLGHLVQQRSTTVSYKNKTKIFREPEEMITVYNTHEPIVTQELWDKCREMEASISQGKKEKTGIVQPLSGLVCCVDCGAKMYVGWNNTRHKRGDPRIYYRQNYNCVSYARFGTRLCPSHYIKLETLHQIVLTDIRDKIEMVQIDEKQAREEFLRRSEENSVAVTSADKRKIMQGKKRLDELDKLIAAAYEDKVIGRIPEEICVNLLSKYQEERQTLKAEVSEAEARIADAEKNRADVEEFIRRLKAYGDPMELTREMCMELIEFVTVDKCPGRYSKEPREVHIYYKLLDKRVAEEMKQETEKTCADN